MKLLLKQDGMKENSLKTIAIIQVEDDVGFDKGW